MLPSIFKPQFNYKLLRIGSRYDGGYLVESNSLSNSECLISFGISTNWDFERDFLNYNKIDLFAFDGSINEEFWISQKKEALKKIKRLSFNKYLKNFYLKKKFYKFFNSDNFTPKFISNTLENSLSFIDAINFTSKTNIFLKIDIEGSEYEILDEIIRFQERIIGIVIEFHKFNKNLERIRSFVKKLNLKLVHLHANNNDGCDLNSVPQTIEITFSRYPIKLGKFTPLPNELDMPNKRKRKEIVLKFSD
tara:strand:+ start:3596 stop:4342 length:747 start_codon:yes stop_codon:yes gene_type:complete